MWLINRYLQILCYVSYIYLLVARISCGCDWECAHQKKPPSMQAGGSAIVFVPSCRGGMGWAGEGGGGGMVEGIPPIPTCIFMPLHFPLLFFALCPLKLRLPCFCRRSRLLLNL